MYSNGIIVAKATFIALYIRSRVLIMPNNLIIRRVFLSIGRIERHGIEASQYQS